MVNQGKKASGKRNGAPAPLSAHPAFPAIVALWFAALLSLGSLVLPVALIERLVELTGVSTLIPSAQPPLGVTARMLFALSAGLSGTLVGLYLARKMADLQKSPPIGRSLAAKIPISAREELGSNSLDQQIGAPQAVAAPQAGVRRRALNVTDEAGPSEFLEQAPLPGGPALFDEPLELTELEKTPELVGAPEPAVAAERPLPRSAETSQASSFDTGMMPLKRPGASLSFSSSFDALRTRTGEQLRRQFDGPAADDGSAMRVKDPEELIMSPLAGLQMVELVERFALSLQRAVPDAGVLPATGIPGDKISKWEHSFSEVAEPRETEPEAARLEMSGLFKAQPAATIPDALRPVYMDDFADPFGNSHLNEDGDEDLMGPVDLKAALASHTRRFDRPAPGCEDAPAQLGKAPSADADFNDQFDASEGAYSSILDMKRAFRAERETVRIEEDPSKEGSFEPAVTFPGQKIRRATPAADGPTRDPVKAPVPGFHSSIHIPASAASEAPAAGRKFGPPVALQDAVPPPLTRPNPAETERALRDALAKLQKMSGAA